MYRYHTPSGDKSCDGLAMALRAGLTLRDMEMVQFHPTGLLAGPGTRMTGTVLEEGLRGAGGYLTVSTHVGDGWLFRLSPFYPAGPRTYPSRLTAEPIEAGPHTLSPTQRLLTELHESLTTGAPLISTGRDGAAALELGLACHASHLAGSPIRLPLADRSLRVPNR